LKKKIGRINYCAPSLNAAAVSIIFAFAMFSLFTRPTLATAGEAASVLEGNHPEEAADLASEGTASPSQPLKMRVTLALNHRKDLEQLLAAQQNPSSPSYHKWLKPDDFTSRFGPTDAQIQKVSNWIKSKGFVVDSASAATRTITFRGKVAEVEKAFGIRIAATKDGATFANTSDPSVPAEIAPLIDSIQGLDNMINVAPMVHRRGSDSKAVTAAPDAIVNAQGPAFGPQDIYTFYNETSLLNSGIDGSGADCIALIEDSNVDEASLDAFNSQFGLPAFNSGNFSDSFPTTDPGVNGDSLEAMVDINYAHASAPGTPINVYIGNQKNSRTSLGLLDAIVKAVQDNDCGAISISFGVCGGSKKFYRGLDGVFAQANAQGQSIYVASGDTGSAGLIVNKRTHNCGVSSKPAVTEIAASPHVSSIGGTEFNATFDGSGNDVGSVAESVWDDATGASGGGRSKVFKKPSFQDGVTSKREKKRDIPDISFGASTDNPGFFYGQSGSVTCCVGGTSISAPIWAGIAQLIAESKAAARIGNINVRLYQLGSSGSPAIRDVTSGNNSFHGVGGFVAGPGYDLASGWGTPDIAAFVEGF
jgi:subtilase family serine protease